MTDPISPVLIRRCGRDGCENVLTGRQQRWCSDHCRRRGWDAKNRRGQQVLVLAGVVHGLERRERLTWRGGVDRVEPLERERHRVRLVEFERVVGLGFLGVDFPDAEKLELGREAMGMPWVTRWKGLSQAIPPAYTEHIGGYLMRSLEVRDAA